MFILAGQLIKYLLRPISFNSFTFIAEKAPQFGEH